MTFRTAILAFIFAAVTAISAHAQTPGADAQTRALQSTVTELTQAWVNTHTGLLQTQDQLTICQGKNKALEDKLPRQEPIPGPSGTQQ